MKLSIITITCRDNPRFADMLRTISGSLGAQDIELEWIIVDERRRPHLIPSGGPHGDGFEILFVDPLPSVHREGDDKSPAHNSARNAGLLASTGDYCVFLNDCTIVTRGWVLLVADAAKQNMGLRFKAFAMHDMAIPEHGQVTYRDHNDRLRPVPPATVGGACWGAPREALLAIHGFDLAYDGEDKGHDLDAIIRMARNGVKFVTSERAYVISLRRTKTRGEVSTKKEVFVGARNQRLLNSLIADKTRTLPVVSARYPANPTSDAVGGRPALVPDVPKPATKPRADRRTTRVARASKPAREPAGDLPAVSAAAHPGNHAAPVMAPELMDDEPSDPLLAELDD